MFLIEDGSYRYDTRVRREAKTLQEAGIRVSVVSPAYEGDELITIELGERAADEDEGITRHTWTPDPALAV